MSNTISVSSGLLLQAVEDQRKALDQVQQDPIPRGTPPLKTILANLAGLEKQIQDLNSFASNEDIMALEKIKSTAGALAKQAQEKAVTNFNASNYQVSERRVPASIHKLIGEFLGTQHRLCNTLSRDQVSPQPPKIKLRSMSEFERIALEGHLDNDRVLTRCLVAFTNVPEDQITRMHDFVWLAFGCPNSRSFDAVTYLHVGDDSVITKHVADLSTAQRDISRFHLATQHIDFSNVTDRERTAKVAAIRSKFWSSMNWIAREALMRAVWTLRGFTDRLGNRIDCKDINFENTVSLFDHAVFAASFRLAKNSLLLFRSSKDHDAMRLFFETLVAAKQNGGIKPSNLIQAYIKLKENSKDTAKLLAFIVGNGLSQDPNDGERRICTAAKEKEIIYIFEIAQELLSFEVGQQYQAPVTIRTLLEIIDEANEAVQRNRAMNEEEADFSLSDDDN